jgi:heme-degrading monooxygenase HmoA
MGSGYSYMWEFLVPSNFAAEFERHYGPAGTWARLFRRSPGYIGTLLLADRSAPGRYVTIDRWQDEASHAAFQNAFASEYSALDAACAKLTTRETLLGIFRE